MRRRLLRRGIGTDCALLVRTWLQDIWFDSANGVCHVKLQTDSTPGISGFEAPSKVEWLQTSENHVAIRLLSFLVRWVNCRDHAPRLEDILTLLRHLQGNHSKAASLALTHESVIDHGSDTSSTVYRKERARTLQRSLQNVETPAETRASENNTANERTAASSFQAINVAGILFSPPRSKGIPHCWTISRQPMSRLDQKATSTRLCVEDAKEVDQLWDQRFFIRIQYGSSSITPSTTAQSQLLIRPLTMDDVRQVNQLLENQGNQEGGSRNQLETWMTQVPGRARFTIPVIFSVKEDRVLSLPTLGIHLDPSPITVSSWFKSKVPQDSLDITFMADGKRRGEIH